MIPSTLITLCLAEYSSRDDLHQIGKGSKIRHGLQWLFRAAVVALACWLDDCTLYAVPLAFLFSAVFRWRLNGLRGKDWRYVSFSNWYDSAFLSITRTPWYIFAGEHYVRAYRAGTLAYIFEGACFVAGTAWYICSMPA